MLLAFCRERGVFFFKKRNVFSSSLSNTVMNNSCIGNTLPPKTIFYATNWNWAYWHCLHRLISVCLVSPLTEGIGTGHCLHWLISVCLVSPLAEGIGTGVAAPRLQEGPTGWGTIKVLSKFPRIFYVVHLLTRALLGGRLNAPPPPRFFEDSENTAARSATGFHTPYPPCFPQLLWKFWPKVM